MSLKEKIILYQENKIQLQEIITFHDQLIRITAKYPEVESIESLLNTLHSEAGELQDLLNELSNQYENVDSGSPRIVLRSIIKDEGINLAEIAEQLEISLFELNNAIDNYSGNPIVKRLLQHFGIPLKHFSRFLGPSN
ncbi:hypothetical protein A8L34_27780 [Bacillus sp. FJAT-27264]|uniref:hypothetical protein n=1 Tax=Paenibacillus sp. (strain DSM 101736 / FJAT-27264) TaxID=1850362 RepID=UPI000808131E|nr:hypothetical protein [Bacillus sp. FJAT-27264]OBZ15850.1 hypothetical protein A8L34_27780 [Bacillus sp. FJAT-27264]